MATEHRRSWFRRLFSRARAESLDPTRDDLVIVASSFDDAESCSAALSRGEQSDPALEPLREVLLRHHLMLPPDMIDDAAAVAAQDGYALGTGEPAAEATGVHLPVEDGVTVVLQRVQVLDALHCSQERSRMAGLAQRRGGAVLGWDALQPARSMEATAD